MIVPAWAKAKARLMAVACVRGIHHGAGAGRRRALRLTTAAVLAVLVCGCTGHTAPSTVAVKHATSSPSPSPSATPMTAAELAWIAAIKHMHSKVDKRFMAGSIVITQEELTLLRTTARRCGRDLRNLGFPGARLEPVYETVAKACRTYDKAARCFARAASVSDAYGATFAGTPQDRIQQRSLSCGFADQGNASNRLTDAETQAQSIESQA